MDYALSEHQQAIQETARRFAVEKLAPHYQKRAAESRLDRAMLKQMGALGLIGANLPEEYGGLGESNVTSGITPGIGAISTPTVTSGTPGGFPRRD